MSSTFTAIDFGVHGHLIDRNSGCRYLDDEIIIISLYVQNQSLLEARASKLPPGLLILIMHFIVLDHTSQTPARGSTFYREIRLGRTIYMQEHGR